VAHRAAADSELVLDAQATYRAGRPPVELAQDARDTRALVRIESRGDHSPDVPSSGSRSPSCHRATLETLARAAISSGNSWLATFSPMPTPRLASDHLGAGIHEHPSELLAVHQQIVGPLISALTAIR